jgi:hypothetical protein
VNLKHPILIFGPNVILINGSRDTKRPEESAPGAFPPVLRGILAPPRSLYRQPIVIKADIERCAIYPGKVYCHNVLTIGFVHVRRRIPIGAFNFIALVRLLHPARASTAFARMPL